MCMGKGGEPMCIRAESRVQSGVDGVGGNGRRGMRPAVAADAGGNAVCAW